MSTIRTEIIDGMSFEDYRNASGVNKSLLDQFARCPAVALDYMQIGRAEPPTKAMIQGSAVDCLVCEPELFDQRFYVRPSFYGPDEKPWNGNAKDCKSWIAAHQDKPILSDVEYVDAQRIARAVRADPKAEPLLEQCKIQQSLFWSASFRPDLQLKGRPDLVGPNFAIDLKVTSDASEWALSKTIEHFRYHVQAAMYWDGLVANGRQVDAFYLLAVEPGERPKVNIRRLKNEAIELGRMTYANELDRFAHCLATSNWPGFSGDGTEILEIDLPPYAYTKGTGSLTLTVNGKELPI